MRSGHSPANKDGRSNVAQISNLINDLEICLKTFFDPSFYNSPFSPVSQNPKMVQKHEVNIHQSVLLTLNSNNLIQLNTKICGLEVSNVLDTGASKSLISKSCLERLVRNEGNIKLKKLNFPIKIRLGDTSSVECGYSVQLDVELESDFYPLDLLVLENLPYDILFGIFEELYIIWK